MEARRERVRLNVARMCNSNKNLDLFILVSVASVYLWAAPGCSFFDEYMCFYPSKKKNLSLLLDFFASATLTMILPS